MLSIRTFQNIIFQMKEATGRALGVIDTDGTVVACGDMMSIGVIHDLSLVDRETFGDMPVCLLGRTYAKLAKRDDDEYFVFSQGDDEIAKTVCVMAAIAINEAGSHSDENHDKCAFIKSIVSENILPGDINLRAKELQFYSDVSRGVLVVRHTSSTDLSVLEFLQDQFPDKQRDFVFHLSNSDIVIVKEMPTGEEQDILLKQAKEIEQKLEHELATQCVIGIGTTAKQLTDLADKFKEAVIAIEVGKVFDSGKTVISYESLGIGRLIYQLPTTLCEIFLSEVFKKSPIEALDQETLFTIDKFFENSLNVSETSRKLFVHRNTLVYRLEKIKRITGLDLREFDHAIIFKVALMVKKYLVSQESKY